MAWSKTNPATGIKARDLDDQVRTNNDALEGALAAHCAFATGGAQTGLLNIGAHKLYAGTTAPTTKEDGSTVFDSSDYGKRIWLDTNTEPGVFKVLTAAATWTPISELLSDCVKLREKSGDPTNGANYGWIYTKDVSGATELFYIDHTGNVKQLTAAGKLNVSPTEAVLLTGVQTVAGVKTFSSIPVLPAADPTTDNQASRKKYIDDAIKAISQPSGRMYLNAQQNNLTVDTWNLINLDSISANFDASICDTTNHKVTPGQTGLYLVSAGIELGTLADAQKYILGVRKNGSGNVMNVSVNAYQSTSRNLAVCDVVYLDNNDYVELVVYPTGANSDALVGEAKTWLTVQRVR